MQKWNLRYESVYFLHFDEMGCEDVDDENEDEYKGLYRKLLSHCDMWLLCLIYKINNLYFIYIYKRHISRSLGVFGQPMLILIRRR